MPGYFVYVNRSEYDLSLFLGHVMYQVRSGTIEERLLFKSHSYQEARDVAQLVCDYLNGAL